MPKGKIDYLNVEIPEGKDPLDYTYYERRREIIDEIKEVQDPNLVYKTKLAERYDVTKGQITHDFDAIMEYLNRKGWKKNGGRVKLFLDNLFDDIVREKKKQVRHGEATQKELYDFVREHARWLMDIGHIDKAADKHEISIEEDIKNKTDELIKFSEEDED